MAKLQFFCNRLIAGQIGLMEIIQQATALANHFQEAAAGTMVLDVLLQMLGQVINSLGQKGHLHVGGTCVLVVKLKTRYRLSFFHMFLPILFMNSQFNGQPGACKALFYRASGYFPTISPG
jgi:hypothetical protein